MKEESWKSLSERAKTGLCCPRCKQPLSVEGEGLRCNQAGCDRIYPIVAGIPVLVNEENSLFSIIEYHSDEALRTRGFASEAGIKRFLPGISKNLHSEINFRQFALCLQENSPQPIVLVVGGRVTGQGMHVLTEFPALEFVSSDIAFGARTQLIVDAHDIPYPDGFFDGVIAQAVLEHVLDPQRCVSEIHRVLKPQGVVYAETPFMQQVHEGRYDFTRFTRLGHRRLFRWFEEIQSGSTGGPGMSLAWAWRYFLLSFARRRQTRVILGGLARLTAFFWKYFDAHLATKPGGNDAASGFYFLGRRSETAMDDCELIRQYHGAVGVE